MQVGGGPEAEVCVTHTLAHPRRPETVEIAAYQVRGQRDEQQDRFIVHKLSDTLLLVGVFDGHGEHGGRIAEVVARMLPLVLANKFTATIADPATIVRGLRDAFLYIDQTLIAKERTHATDSGTTGVAVIITPTHYISANVGDSRAVLIRRGPVVLEATTLSVDHDTQNVQERTRACAAGATLDDEYFVLGDAGLQLSRAFGDLGMKAGTPPILLCEPDIKIMRRATEDAYVWLFSDGVTDAMSGYEHSWYVSLMNRMYKEGTCNARALARAVVSDALGGLSLEKPVASAGLVSSDNITTVLVQLPERRGIVGSAVTRRRTTSVTGTPAPVVIGQQETKTAKRRQRKRIATPAHAHARGVTLIAEKLI